MVNQKRARPFLKWAGGKTQLLESILSQFPKTFGRYHEPFIGGGAVFFALQPEKASLSDINGELIRVYQALRDDVESVIECLGMHKAEERYYYRVRAQKPEKLSDAEAAARLIFLNKTCYNGLYRVNLRGEFNVPFGRYRNPTICNSENLRLASIALKKAKLHQRCVFESSRWYHEGDLVYLDPPYAPLSTTSSFTQYTNHRFALEEQERLAELFTKLVERGVYVLLSNSDTPLVRTLFKGFKIQRVNATRRINSAATKRGNVGEVLIRA